MRFPLIRRAGHRRVAVVRSRATIWRRLVRLEQLETRELLSGINLFSTGLDNVFALPSAYMAPAYLNPVPSGDTPGQIRQAYGFNQVTFSNGTTSITGNGSNQTIAIVDAYGDSKITSDLHAFDNEFGLPDPSLKVVNQNGGNKLPGNNSGWALETSLDVEWAHAMAPNASLLLVEANSSSLGNLLTAVNYASKQPGVVAVSMSWGTSEFSGETAYDSYFTTPSGHGGVTFIAASGDNGAPAIWPATSPNVLSVGGTTLSLADSSGTYGSESGWSGSGGGVSLYEPQPTYQSASGLVTQSSTNRTTPDVSYNADPNSGVAVYDSISYSGQSGWFQVGGTSAAAPQWAALVAVADQGRQIANGGVAASLHNAQASVYSVASNATSYSSSFHDVTTGSNGSGPLDSAGTGYDLVTGLGTPKVASLVQALVHAPDAAVITTASTSAKTSPGSPSPTIDPGLVAEIFFLELTPPVSSGVAFVPVLSSTTPNPPTAASSLVMPAETPVQLSSNSLLTDDPSAVPFAAPRRVTSGAGNAPASDGSTTSPGRSNVGGIWGRVGEDSFADGWSALAEGDSAAASSAADTIFADSAPELFADVAPAGGMAAFADGRTQQVAGLIGLVAAAVLMERGSRTDDKPTAFSRWRRK